jgi:hypothetical protein
MDEMIERLEEEMTVEEETPFERIEGLMAEIQQMERMIEENIRKIAEGDDVEGRTYLKKHLENEVYKKNKEVEKLQSQL